jgi:hypothetical protein
LSGSSPPYTLATITADALQPLVGETFAVRLPSGRAAEAFLKRVDVRGTYPMTQRAAFSFILRVPGDRTDAQQGTLHMEHAKIGALDPFAVPVGQDGDAILWEVVFS